jgi:hypothetical protein
LYAIMPRVIMLSVIILSAIMLSVIILSAIMLTVIMLSGILLSVAAPFFAVGSNFPFPLISFRSFFFSSD